VGVDRCHAFAMIDNHMVAQSIAGVNRFDDAPRPEGLDRRDARALIVADVNAGMDGLVRPMRRGQPAARVSGDR
jgi:hypothetical protein